MSGLFTVRSMLRYEQKFVGCSETIGPYFEFFVENGVYKLCFLLKIECLKPLGSTLPLWIRPLLKIKVWRSVKSKFQIETSRGGVGVSHSPPPHSSLVRHFHKFHQRSSHGRKIKKEGEKQRKSRGKYIRTIKKLVLPWK